MQVRALTSGLVAVAIWGAPAAAQRPAAAGPDTGGQARRAPPRVRPLQRLADRHVLVLPARYVSFTDSLGWSSAVGSPAAYLGTLDDEIAYALRERGLAHRWTFASGVEREARENDGLVPDPRALDAEEVRIGGRTDAWQLGEPLASQLRGTIALTEARYVLYPVEVRFASRGSTGVAMLHVVVIDARRSHVEWTGNLTGAPTGHFSRAIAADLASKLGELIAPVTR